MIKHMFYKSATEWFVYDMSGRGYEVMRVSRTHQDIRRVTHTGGVYEGGLTSLTPERQFRRLFQLLHIWNQINLSSHSALYQTVGRPKLLVRTNKMGTCHGRNKMCPGLVFRRGTEGWRQGRYTADMRSGTIDEMCKRDGNTKKDEWSVTENSLIFSQQRLTFNP